VLTGTTTSSDGTSAFSYSYTGDHLNPTSGHLMNPSATYTYAFTSSADERMLHADIDMDEDGTVDGTNDVTYDSKRREIESITYFDGNLVVHEKYAYTDGGQSSLYSYATQEGPEDYVVTSHYNSHDMWTDTVVTSPSGALASSEYTETAKTTCSVGRRAPSAALGARSRRAHLRDPGLPVLFGAW
jgi:hypothetical protein